ncbi:hypothetical protein HYR99_02095 [Candidatus Poribacteria bacterium]|nr:hypothetical protein [Candidatus Poribacteria bacterium]
MNSRIISQIAAHLQTVPEQVQITPIRHGTLERNNVWGLTVSGKRYILKQHLIAHPIGESAFTPFQVESAVLSTLHQESCRVPQIFWKSEADWCLLLEWCGEKTLDDQAQETPTTGLKEITRNVVQEFCRLENGFANQIQAIKPYIYPMDYPAFLRDTMQALLARGRKTMGYLGWLRGQPMPPDQQTAIDAVWEHLSDCLHRAGTTFGSLDYNGRNVVVDGDKPTFIDFASVGWDWQERRLVQSLNSLGANRLVGNFVCLLDGEIVREYASQVVTSGGGNSEEEIAARVDYHNLLFYLSIVYRLLQATAQPERLENRLLLKAWGDAKVRLRRAIDLLVDSHLSDDPYANQIRELIAEFRIGQ